MGALVANGRAHVNGCTQATGLMAAGGMAAVDGLPVANGVDTAGRQTQEAVTLASLLARRHVWQWRVAPQPVAGIATGIRALDAVLPMGGWPAAALSELLVPVWGLTELQLLWPVLARLSRAGGRVVLVAPPFVPFAGAWQRAGVDLSRLAVIGAAATTGAADAPLGFRAVFAFGQLCGGRGLAGRGRSRSAAAVAGGGRPWAVSGAGHTPCPPCGAALSGCAAAAVAARWLCTGAEVPGRAGAGAAGCVGGA